MKSEVVKVEKRIINKDSKSENILSYDVDNRYPQRIIDIINASGTAKRCVETYAKYIIGGGFKDETFYRSVVNSNGLTADKLLRITANNLANLGGRAYHVNYNGVLQISEVSPIPFEYCRQGIGEKAGMIAVYEDWECATKSRIEKENIKWYHRFTKNEVVTMTQISVSGGLANYQGQIYTNEKYPLAPIDAVIMDAISDNEIQVFTHKELKNGFNPSVIAQYERDFEDKEWEDLLETYESFQGSDNTGKIMIVSGLKKDSFILNRLESSGMEKMYESTGNRVKQSIIQRFGIPPSLLGRREGGGVINSQNIEDDTKFYNSITTDERTLIEEDMKLLFANFHIPINPTGDYSILELTFNAIATEVPSKISTLGIGGTQALMGVLQSDLDNTVKINTLQIIFGLTEDEATKMVLPIPVTA